MAELLLPSLEIENFRAFKHLTIEKLGRVNLIVGENGVGKSTLLEAIEIYSWQAILAFLERLTARRDEYFNVQLRGKQQDAASEIVWNRLAALKSLFYNQYIEYGNTRIEIGSEGSNKGVLSFGVDLFEESYSMVGERAATKKLLRSADQSSEPGDTKIPCLVVGQKKGGVFAETDTTALTTLLALFPKQKPISCIYVPANGLSEQEISTYWDAIALTDQEASVLAGLNSVISGVERISVVGQKDNDYSRFPIAKLRGIGNPVPLRSLGDGAIRALGISLSLANSKNGILLIDEFENGLYHGVQTDLWRLIFRVAHELNVQIFATTHSWDCIAAFQQAAEEDPNEEAMLIRLQRKRLGGEIEAVYYDERRLSIATNSQIEVR